MRTRSASKAGAMPNARLRSAEAFVDADELGRATRDQRFTQALEEAFEAKAQLVEATGAQQLLAHLPQRLRTQFLRNALRSLDFGWQPFEKIWEAVGAGLELALHMAGANA